MDELEAQLAEARDELADYDNNMLRKFDPEAADSTDLYTYISCKLQEIVNLKSSLDFCQRRIALLQEQQKKMRDPERTIVCDILANGSLLPDPEGRRYGQQEEK